MRKTLPVLLLALYCFSAAALPAVQAEVSKAETPVKLDSAAGSDARLSQKITYDARRKTVLEILTDLSKLSGVTLKAGQNDADFQVRDRKMNVFVKDLPLLTVMNSTARAMKYTWSKSNSDPPSYRLYMSRKTFLEAEEQARGREQEWAEQQKQARKALLETLHKAVKAEGTQDNPYVQVLLVSGAAEALDTLFTELPAARDAFINEEEIRIGAASMTVNARQALVKLASSMGRLSFGEPAVVPDLSAQADRLALILNREDVHDYSGQAPSFIPNPFGGSLGFVLITYPRSAEGERNASCPIYYFPIEDPESGFAKGIGPHMLKNAEGEAASTTPGTPIRIAAPGGPGNEFHSKTQREPAIEHGEDSALQIDVECKPEKIKRRYNTLESLDSDGYMAAIAHSSDFGVVSDCIADGPLVQPRAGKQSLVSVLDILSFPHHYHYNWWRHGKVLEFRDRDWFKKVSLMIPQSWIEKWRATMEKTGTLPIDDLAEIARLMPDDEHFNANLDEDDVLRSSGIRVTGREADFLRYWAVLRPQQRNQVLSKTGLDMDTLSEEQWTAFDRVMPCGREVLVRPVITGTQNGRNYSFRIAGGAEAEFYISAPNYQDPTKPKPADGQGDSLETIRVLKEMEITIQSH